MGSLTLEQRVKRAVTRHNNKVAEKYPLFANQFATNEKEQTERINKLDKFNEQYFHNLNLFEQASWQMGGLFREMAQELLKPEEFTVIDQKFIKIFADFKSDAGVYFADHWHTAIREYFIAKIKAEEAIK